MNLKEVDLREIYNLWKKDLREYRCFFRSTPFVSLKTYKDFKLHEYKNEADENLAKKIAEEYDKKYFTIVDLEFSEILDLSVELNNKFNIKPILNVNLLFNEFGLIGDEADISKLINAGLKLKDTDTDKYVMMIPYGRFIENLDVNKINDKLNNQYAAGFDDFPDEEFLKTSVYEGIKVITRGNVKEDLMDYLKYIMNNIEVKVVKVE